MYALGALEPAERRAVQEHLRSCEECRTRLREEQALVQLLPRTVNEVQPSRETKLKLFARVDADLATQGAQVQAPETKVERQVAQAPRGPISQAPAPGPARRSWVRQPVWALAGLAALVLVVLAGWLALQNNVSPEQRAIAGILNDPAVQMVALAGTKDAPGAQAEMYMVPGHSQAVLKVSGLAPLAADKGYEFWFFKGQDPQPSAVFTVSGSGAATVLVKAQERVENYNAWGVTIEPRAGVAKPTGPVVLLGGG